LKDPNDKHCLIFDTDPDEIILNEPFEDDTQPLIDSIIGDMKSDGELRSLNVKKNINYLFIPQ